MPDKDPQQRAERSSSMSMTGPQAGLGTEEVAKLAQLARLGDKGEELEQLTADLQTLTTQMTPLEQVDTQGLAPLVNPWEENSQTLRDDQVTESDESTQLLTCAPACDQALFLVPRVIE
ncbi:MAG: Asp-tRNA(Asn)/Glu-tRNA(Gln) amidotransferase subunit GatC [Kistimonas sp.]|nr:Asp-tRNA(Asn)/Glu-tRNA(Gln) amidotransferase subunit GatC [Kistimonas sp.]